MKLVDNMPKRTYFNYVKKLQEQERQITEQWISEHVEHRVRWVHHFSIMLQSRRSFVHQLCLEYPVVLDLLSLFHQHRYFLWQEFAL